MKPRRIAVAALVLLLSSMQPARAEKPLIVQGAGTTMVAGGTGSLQQNLAPVITRLAFHWNGTEGTLDCLALVPSTTSSSPGSANFDTNVMYVTGQITSVTIKGGVASIAGKATCTGLGAGVGVPFTATAYRGGPGTKFVLKVSGLTFTETLLDGGISF